MIRSSSRAAERMDVNSIDKPRPPTLLRECNNFKRHP
jgi:hypothetical protein